MATDPGQIHLRLGEDIKLVDRYVAHIRETTGAELSRAEAACALIRRGFSAHETEQKGKKR